jgi:predicted Rossmann-fold nucleotide-binding protein
MAKSKTATLPDTHVLKVIIEEYLEMLAEAQSGIKKLLPLSPQKEEFWDKLSELDPTITLIESRSGSIHEEIDNLIDQLPED